MVTEGVGKHGPLDMQREPTQGRPENLKVQLAPVSSGLAELTESLSHETKDRIRQVTEVRDLVCQMEEVTGGRLSNCLCEGMSQTARFRCASVWF